VEGKKGFVFIFFEFLRSTDVFFFLSPAFVRESAQRDKKSITLFFQLYLRLKARRGLMMPVANAWFYIS